MSLRDANRHLTAFRFFAAITFESLNQFVELILLVVQRRQFLNQRSLVIDLFRFFEGSPIDFNRFVVTEFVRQRSPQRHRQRRFCRIDSHRFSQRIEPHFRFAQPITELRIELVIVGISRCRNDQFLTGSNRFVAVTQLSFQSGNVHQVFAAQPSIDLRKLSVDGSCRSVVARRFGNASRRGQHRNRLLINRESFLNRFARAIPIAIGFQISGQYMPVIDRLRFITRGHTSQPFDLFVKLSIGLKDLDPILECLIGFLIAVRQISGCLIESQRLAILSVPHMVFSSPQLQRELFRIKLTGQSNFLDRLRQVSEAVVNLCQPRDVFRRLTFAFGNRFPNLQRLIGAFQNMKVLTKVLAILRFAGREFDCFLVTLNRFGFESRLTIEIGNLRMRDRIVGSRFDNSAPNFDRLLATF